MKISGGKITDLDFTKRKRCDTISIKKRWTDMEYEIKRSDRRTVAITIRDGKVILRAPKRLSDKDAEKIINSHLEWINSKLSESEKKKEAEPQLSDKEIAALKRSARKFFADKTAYFSKIMNLQYGRITITSAKTRFGSCSSKGNISYSYRLMLYPEEAREYVVVHELAHLLEMNHSKRFYAVVEKYLPDYKLRRRLLKNG